MKVVIAKNIGFCSGVKRAIALTERALKEGPPPVQFLGELVHNENVLEYFLKKGVKFTKRLPAIKTGTLIIQAHGRPPLPPLPGITIKDATCPLVKRVQLTAKSFYQQGYQVIVLGDENHSEVIGIKGYTDNQALVVKDEKEATKLPFIKKAALVAQTTQNHETFKKTFNALKKKTKELNRSNTICPEVAARQQEIKEILETCDGVLLIGSKLSANTERLAERAKQLDKTLVWINSLKELKSQMPQIKCQELGVISGTSTPNWEINKIRKYLKKYAKEN
jgi:4-hydroxy-3-methylbut-2-enyl diphosphate reductase